MSPYEPEEYRRATAVILSNMPIDFKAQFEAAHLCDADYAELLDGRFARTTREVEDFQRDQQVAV
jgi:hypothetical protein